MGARTVGAGRGAVFAGGQVYMEGATIPGDVEVGEHVFADVEAVEGNVTVTPVMPITNEAPAEAEPAETPADTDPSRGTIDEVRARIAAGEASAADVLAAEQAKGDKARSTLVDELEASVNAGT